MDKLVPRLFYLLFFLVPLFFTPWTFELFEFNKMMLIYVFTILITASWVLSGFRLRRTPFDIPIFLFLISNFVSTILSIHLRTSLIGYYSRFHGGLFSTISYILLYYAFVSNMNKENVLRATRYLLSAAALVAVYALAQHFGIDKHLWVQDVQNRVFSTLGQPNWLAAFLIMVIPLSLGFSLNSEKPSLFIILNSLFFASLLFTQSRSGLLGFSLAYGIFWFLVFLKNKFKYFRQFIIHNSLFIILLVIFPPSVFAQDALGGGTESGDIRKIVWQGALDVWRHYPIFGSGVETFAYSYYNFRPAAHNLVSEWDFLYNKAHNEYLNLLATTGAVGLGSYLLLQLWVFIWLLRRILHTSYFILHTALLAALAGLSVSNFFGFSTTTVGLLFFLFPAFAVVLTDNKNQELRIKNHAALFIIPASLFMLQFLGRWYYADMLFASGKKYSDAGYPQRGWSKLEQAVNLMPNEPNFRIEFAQTSADLALAFTNAKDATSASQLKALALENLTLAQKQNPVHLNFVKTAASSYFTLAQLDPELNQNAKDALLYGIKLSPTDAKLWYNLGLFYLTQKDNSSARLTLEKTIELKPNYEQARMSLGQLYEDLGDTQKAIVQYKYILDRIQPKNTQAKQKLEELTN